LERNQSPNKSLQQLKVTSEYFKHAWFSYLSIPILEKLKVKYFMMPHFYPTYLRCHLPYYK